MEEGLLFTFSREQLEKYSKEIFEGADKKTIKDFLQYTKTMADALSILLKNKKTIPELLLLTKMFDHRVKDLYKEHIEKNKLKIVEEEK